MRPHASTQLTVEPGGHPKRCLHRSIRWRRPAHMQTPIADNGSPTRGVPGDLSAHLPRRSGGITCCRKPYPPCRKTGPSRAASAG